MSGVWFIGVDAHKRVCMMVALTLGGEVAFRRKFKGTLAGWREAFADLPKGCAVAIECVGWYQPIFDLLEEMGQRLTLVNARELHLIGKSKKKTDWRDAEKIAGLLRSGFLPVSHVPSKPMRELRELTRHNDRLVSKMISLKNEAHRLFERLGVEEPEVDDLFGKQGTTWMRAVQLRADARLVLDSILVQHDTLAVLRQRLESEIARRVKDDADVMLLLEIDGINLIGAATLKAEIDTITRFPNRKTIRANFGLAVTHRNSADTEHHGHITKEGSGIVRKMLVQAVPHVIKHNPKARDKFDRITQRTSGQKKGVARVAVAAYLLEIMYQMLKYGTHYRYARPHAVRDKLTRIERKAEREDASYAHALHEVDDAGTA